MRALYEFRKFHLFLRALRRIEERSLVARLTLFSRKRIPELYDIVRLSNFFVSDRHGDSLALFATFQNFPVNRGEFALDSTCNLAAISPTKEKERGRKRKLVSDSFE